VVNFFILADGFCAVKLIRPSKYNEMFDIPELKTDLMPMVVCNGGFICSTKFSWGLSPNKSRHKVFGSRSNCFPYVDRKAGDKNACCNNSAHNTNSVYNTVYVSIIVQFRSSSLVYNVYSHGIYHSMLIK